MLPTQPRRSRGVVPWTAVLGLLWAMLAATLPWESGTRLAALGSHGAQQPAPAGLTAVVTGQSVTLTWQAPASAPTHLVQAGSAPGASNLAQVVVPGSPAVFQQVPPGTYFVRVRAAEGSGWGAPSNETVVRVSCAFLPAPGDLAAQVGGGLVSLSWEAVEDATAYVVDAGSGPGRADLARLPVGSAHFATDAPAGVYYVRVRAVSGCGNSVPSNEVIVAVRQPSQAPIHGAVDPAILGTCSAAAHDAHVVDGGDGFRYRTWHPQVDPTRCVYAHEHGDDPAQQTNLDIRAAPVRFGYIGRRMSLDEAHEGFKVSVANRGDINTEGRASLVDSRLVVHMGTGSPGRFSLSQHSVEQRVAAPGGVRIGVQALADVSGLTNACAQSQSARKTVVMLDPACVPSAPYEAWFSLLRVQYQERDVYFGLATTVVIDPITAFDPGNPMRLLYLWDPALGFINRDGADWSSFRGCDRETYHAVGYILNGSEWDTGRTIFYTDVMGNEVLPGDPGALRQEVSRQLAFAPPAADDGSMLFRLRHGQCGLRARLGLKN